MKKIFMMMMAVMFSLIIGFSSCNSCKNSQVAPVDSTVVDSAAIDSAAVDSTINEAVFVVENIVSTDRQSMYLNYGGDYRWFETCILMKDFLDSEDCDGTIAGLSNVFQVVREEGKTADVHVILYAHTPDTTTVEVKEGFWVEDMPMNNEAIKVTFKQAYDKMMQANCPKPHSKHCVLRKQVGPVEANPQYIFGNTHAQVYVDAITGAVSTSNPAFPKEKGFKMPLGEWP